MTPSELGGGAGAHVWHERSTFRQVPALEVTEHQPQEGAVHLRLAGELDLASAYAFDRRLLEVESKRPTLIVLDLREVTMLDSAGLARLVSAHRRARRGGWRLVLIRGGKVVSRVLQTTRLDEHLEVMRELPAAVRGTV
jgi:anti-sigma B factor antagonist